MTHRVRERLWGRSRGIGSIGEWEGSEACRSLQALALVVMVAAAVARTDGQQGASAVTLQHPEASTQDCVEPVGGVRGHGGGWVQGEEPARRGRARGVMRLRSTVLKNICDKTYTAKVIDMYTK